MSAFEEVGSLSHLNKNHRFFALSLDFARVVNQQEYDIVPMVKWGIEYDDLRGILSYPPGSTNLAVAGCKSGPWLKMYFLLRLGIFQPVFARG